MRYPFSLDTILLGSIFNLSRILINYGCSFFIVYYLKYLDLPRDGPHITGEQKQYEKGDLLNINCTSGKSHPSSTIQWFINDEPVSCLHFNKNINLFNPTVLYPGKRCPMQFILKSILIFLLPFFSLSLSSFILYISSVGVQVFDSYVMPYPPVVHSHGLVTTILGMQIQLDSSHFDNGSMRVKCLTSVSPVIPIHSSVVSDGSAAEARESGLSPYDADRKTNYAQRKPPLADSREAYILGKCVCVGVGAV